MNSRAAGEAWTKHPSMAWIETMSTDEQARAEDHSATGRPVGQRLQPRQVLLGQDPVAPGQISALPMSVTGERSAGLPGSAIDIDAAEQPGAFVQVHDATTSGTVQLPPARTSPLLPSPP